MNTLQKNRIGNLFPGTLHEMDSLLDHFLGPQARVLPSGWRAPASIWESEDGFHIELDVPGVRQEDLELTFDKGELAITARRPAPEEKPERWHNERSFGETRRTVTLPEAADPNAISAQLEQGVLHVTVGKRPESQPRRIDVSTGN